ncbi:hypothetical protein EZV62_027403 [Acer yangbiense]|uniref:Tr-type G domain-containing protein n=1 Tax=Acer yangbiense TaxID=1000413 RepID=A0A5C7GUF2_9ROSI|nr:hypothetical protein EZV62_027403 [Acer yangbiense]
MAAANTEIEKINVYAPVSTDDHDLTPKFDVNVDVDGPVITKSTPDTHEKKKNQKRRVAYFFCCSNIEFDTTDEDDKAKALVFFQNTNKNRSCVTMCCSNLEMGPKNNLANKFVWMVAHLLITLIRDLVPGSTIGWCTLRRVGTNYTDLRVDEIEHSFSIELIGVSLCYEMSGDALKEYKGDHQGNAYVFNIIDSLGHAEFSSELTTALRITEVALLIVDCAEGFSFHTETVLRQSLSERIRPVLAINKIDRCLTYLSIDGEEAYQMLSETVIPMAL